MCVILTSGIWDQICYTLPMVVCFSWLKYSIECFSGCVLFCMFRETEPLFGKLKF